MNYVATIAATLTAVSLAAGSEARGTVSISIGGNVITSGTHVIVIPDNATALEKYASRELERCLNLVTGQSMDIATDSQVGGRVPIIVGKSSLIEDMGASVDYGALGDDGIIIKSVGPALILTGNTRGVLYAVYTFLEDYVGFRWLSPDCTVVPSGRKLRFRDIDVTHVPPFATRALDCFSAFDQDWAVRNKVNGYGYAKRTAIDAAHGGEVAYPSPLYFWHTIRQWIPLDKYRETHPEYFSELGGKRVTTSELETDYCMTNPEVVKLVSEGVRAALRANPASTMIGVSQNDHTDRYCRCEKCSALVKAHGQPSALIVNLANQVAASLESQFPSVKVTILAYHWSQSPPNDLPLHRNVVVEVCPLGLNQLRPLENTESAYARGVKNDLAGWARLCTVRQVKMCNYSINFAHLYQPHPNLYVFKPNIGYFVKNGAGHFYDCGSYTSKLSEFADLRGYLIAKLAWDPSADTGKIIDDFVSGYYGKASRPIRKYIDLIHGFASGVTGLNMDCYASLETGQFSPAVLERAIKLFDEAEALAKGDPTIADRVEIARLPIMYAQIEMDVIERKKGGDNPRPDVGRQTETLERFLSVLQRHKVTRMTDIDFVTAEEWSDTVRAQIGAPPARDVAPRKETGNL